MPFEPGPLSLLPAAVAIVLAFWFRRALPALFASVITGSLVMFVYTGDPWDLDVVSRFLLPSLGTEGYAKILLIYLWCLGGLAGMWGKTGAAEHVANVAGRTLVRGPRSALLFAWALGCVFHQGGTVSTVLVGTAAKPATDRHGISHEELAYVADSTGSPVATVIPFNAWPAYIGGLAVGTVPFLTTADEAALFMFSSVPYNFYGWLAVLGTGAFAAGWLPALGPLRAAQARARAGEGLDAPGAVPLLPDPGQQVARVQGYEPSLLDFVLPIGVLIILAIVPYLYGINFINQAFVACVLTSMATAAARGMPLAEVLDGFLRGCGLMTVGAVVLGLAVTLGTVSKELGAAAYLVGIIGDAVPAVVLPAVLTVLCMFMAFATGTSWGTYAVVIPIGLPLAWSISPDPAYIQVCFGAILGGAVFGDQCSPVSDTTILSAMFAGCDVMDHVKTQLPMAIGAAGFGVALSALSVMTL